MAVQIPELLAPRRVPAEVPAFGDPSGPITNIADLMRLHDEMFVKAAYPLLLGRKADFVGLNHYCRGLRKGTSRFAVIDGLVRSNEFQGDLDELPGLGAALERYRASRRLAGWKLALKDDELGRLPSHRRARALANAFGAQQQTILAAIEGVKARQGAAERILLELLEEKSGSEKAPSKPTKKKKLPASPRTRSLKSVREVPPAYRDLLGGLRF
jgi:hypothetical protein